MGQTKAVEDETRRSDPVWKEIGKLSKSRGLAAREALPDVVADSWRRCLTDHNLAPDKVPRAAVLSRPELIHLSEAYEDLIAAAEPEVERLFHQLVDSEHLVSFASLQGAMLLFRCDYQLLNDMSACGVLPGSVWTEERQGTNGVGICLRIAKPVSVVASQHYGSDIQALTCLTAPVLGQAGAMGGVLNVTTPRSGDERANRVVQSMVERAARRIEARHFGRIHRRSVILRISRDPESADLAEEGRLALDDQGRVIDGTAQVASLTGRELGDLVGGFADQMFDLDAPLQDFRPGRPFRIAINGKSMHGVLSDPERASRRPVSLGADRQSLAVVAKKIPAGPHNSPEDRLSADPGVLLEIGKSEELLHAGLPLVITGEPGTGKTSLARKVGRQIVGRAGGDLILVDCALLGTLSSAAALFYVGPVPSARCVILDRFDMLSDSAQDVLQSALDQDMGAASPSIIAVGETDLAQVGSAGRFRSNLLNRLKGAAIALPPLRNNRNLDLTIDELLSIELEALDKPGLRLDEKARLILKNYHWPGNQRELRSVLRYGAVLAKQKAIGVEDLPSEVVSAVPRKDLTARSQSEAAKVEAALQHNGGNLSLTARYLGVSRATLYRKIDIQKMRGKTKDR
jgi:transcriptional regulator of acetoin/glycerol metabolism